MMEQLLVSIKLKAFGKISPMKDMRRATYQDDFSSIYDIVTALQYNIPTELVIKLFTSSLSKAPSCSTSVARSCVLDFLSA